MKYRVLPDAQADLEEIDDWVLENFGPAFADQTQGKLYGTFEILTNFPHMGQMRPDVTSHPVRFFSLKPYWIVYETGTPLLIHRVYHSARDLARLAE